MAKRKTERRDPFPLEPAEAVPEVLARLPLVTQPSAPVLPADGPLLTTDQEQPARPIEREPEKKRDRSWDAARSKATFDLPPALIERIRKIAEELGQGEASVKVSDVARLLIEAGLAEYDAGRLRIKPIPTGFRLFDD